MDDVNQACNSLATLQRFYNLGTNELSKGVIKFLDEMSKSKYTLQHEDMMCIGDAAWKLGWMDRGIDWFQQVMYS